MINAEFYKEDILKYTNRNETFALNKYNHKLMMCESDSIIPCCNCDKCEWNEGNERCRFLMTRWLLAEHKEYPKLTRFQYELLKKLINELNWMARDKDNEIYFYTEKPKKSENNWCSDDYYKELWKILDDFDFIKWTDEEPWNIQELLENCEVEE